MRAGKLLNIGESTGVVIHREYMRILGWFRGDIVIQEIRGDELVIRNVQIRKITGAHKRREDGEAKIPRGRASRGV